MRVVVTGATGMIGKAAVSALLKREDQVIALTRDPDRARKRLGGRVQLHAWEDPKLTPPPRAALADADAVLHLLGEPIAQRWSTAIKKEIRESRVLSTRMLLAPACASEYGTSCIGEAVLVCDGSLPIQAPPPKPGTWIKPLDAPGPVVAIGGGV